MPDPLIALLIAAGLFVIGLIFFFPERGFYWRWRRAGELTERVMREDALKHIAQSEIHGDKPTIQSLAGSLNVHTNQVTQLLENLQERELVLVVGTEIQLTPEGRDYALRIIRAHRLYERYLAEETGYSEAEWHDQAHRFEHQLTIDEIESLSTRLGNPTHDPHGDPIPTASGDIVYPKDRIPITSLEIGQPARIVHLEDEPEAVFAQLVAEGLHPGMEVRIIEISPRRVRFWADDDEHLLAPIVAANISVVPLPQPVKAAEEAGERLSTLKPGEQGEVVAVSRAGRASERRRFLDLGILPGTIITAEMTSPSGDPTAYRVREALIALRQEQADLIRIRRLPAEARP